MKKTSTRAFVLLSLLIAVLIVSGYWNIPTPSGLSIVWSMVPVAIAAIALGPRGGAVLGGAFGLMSFLQCFGILGVSKMGVDLLAVGVSPLWLFIQRFVPRLLDGVLIGILYRALRKRLSAPVSAPIVGFAAAFLNTLFFMSALVLIFGNTPYLIEKMAGRAFVVYIVASVGVNGVVEMVTSTILTGAIGAALIKARLIEG